MQAAYCVLDVISNLFMARIMMLLGNRDVVILSSGKEKTLLVEGKRVKSCGHKVMRDELSVVESSSLDVKRDYMLEKNKLMLILTSSVGSSIVGSVESEINLEFV